MLEAIIAINIVREKLEERMLRAFLRQIKTRFFFPPLNTEAISDAFYRAFLRPRR